MSATYKFARNIIVAPGTNDALNRETLSRINYAAYERDTLAALDAIWQGSWTGTSIIQGIGEIPGIKVVITPFPVNSCNAAADPRPTWASAGEINVLYLPSTWAPGSKCVTGPGANADEVLLHELVHAYRQMRGHKSPSNIYVAGFEYENAEEFYAILLTNIHMSAKGQRSLRKDHRNHDRLYPELSTSEPFLTAIKKHRQLVHDFLCDHYGVCQNHIRKDQCAFNPIDYFLKHSSQIIDLDKPKPVPMSPSELEFDRQYREAIEKQNRALKPQSKKPAGAR